MRRAVRNWQNYFCSNTKYFGVKCEAVKEVFYPVIFILELSHSSAKCSSFVTDSGLYNVNRNDREFRDWRLQCQHINVHLSYKHTQNEVIFTL